MNGNDNLSTDDSSTTILPGITDGELIEFEWYWVKTGFAWHGPVQYINERGFAIDDYREIGLPDVAKLQHIPKPVEGNK